MNRSTTHARKLSLPELMALPEPEKYKHEWPTRGPRIAGQPPLYPDYISPVPDAASLARDVVRSLRRDDLAPEVVAEMLRQMSRIYGARSEAVRAYMRTLRGGLSTVRDEDLRYLAHEALEAEYRRLLWDAGDRR